MTLGTAAPVLDKSHSIADLKPRTRDAILTQLATHVWQSGAVRAAEPLLDLLRLRERLGTTAIGKGVALPNARSLTVNRPTLLVGRSRRGVEWDAPDGQPVSLMLLVLSPGEWSEEAHHSFLARAAGVVRLQKNRQRLLGADGSNQVADLLREARP